MLTLLLLLLPPIERSCHFLPKLGGLGRDAREQREQKIRSGSSVGPVDLEGFAKTIGEFARDIEQLELARNEDRATIRELEIGALKGLSTSSRSGDRKADAQATLV